MDTNTATATRNAIDLASRGIEVLAVAIIVSAIVYATVRYAAFALGHRSGPGLYREYRTTLGKSLLLGLEILVAADVVRTVALQATIQSLLALGLLVAIRTFLSWTLELEIEGRWPWQARLASIAGQDEAAHSPSSQTLHPTKEQMHGSGDSDG